MKSLQPKTAIRVWVALLLTNMLGLVLNSTVAVDTGKTGAIIMSIWSGLMVIFCVLMLYALVSFKRPEE